MTVGLALVDFIPVALFALSGILLMRDLYNKLSKGAFALVAAGVIMVLNLIIGASGVFMYIQTDWIPMPSDGLSAAVATASGKSFGDSKTFTDSAIVLIALVLWLVFLRGDDVRSGELWKRWGLAILALLCVYTLGGKLWDRHVEDMLGMEPASFPIYNIYVGFNEQTWVLGL